MTPLPFKVLLCVHIEHSYRWLLECLRLALAFEDQAAAVGMSAE